MNNSYHVLWSGLGEGPVALDLERPEAATTGQNLPYFAGTLRAMEEAAPELRGLTFYLLFSHYDELPSYGDDVVVLLLLDEACRLPRYLGRVGAVFRCLGTRPHLDKPTSSPLLNGLIAARAGRNAAQWVADWVRARAAGVPSHWRTPQFHIPLGYGRQEALPVRPIQEREIDVAFLGSVEHRPKERESVLEWVKSPPGLATPKVLTRERMVQAVERLRAERPDLRVHLHTTGSYQESWSSSPAAYSEALMNTKVCLAPRGTTVETNRYFEGVRAGCVVVSDPLPDYWFYRDGPAIELAGWERLPAVVDDLLAPDALERRHRESLRWWEDVCSERPVGRYMAEALRSVPRVGAASTQRRPPSGAGSRTPA